MAKKKRLATRMMESSSNYIKSYDEFGETVNFNFDGSSAFQTFPGGCISLFMTICVVGYAILQLKYMVNKEEWTLIQQNVLQEKAELLIPKEFRDNTNVTMAIQFN